jgi:hypothetical protein
VTRAHAALAAVSPLVVLALGFACYALTTRATATAVILLGGALLGLCAAALAIARAKPRVLGVLALIGHGALVFALLGLCPSLVERWRARQPVAPLGLRDVPVAEAVVALQSALGDPVPLFVCREALGRRVTLELRGARLDEAVQALGTQVGAQVRMYFGADCPGVHVFPMLTCAAGGDGQVFPVPSGR